MDRSGLSKPGEEEANPRLHLRWLPPVVVLAAAGCLLSLVGWTGTVTVWQHWLTLLAGIVFALERGWMFLQARGKERRRLGWHGLAAVPVAVASVGLLFFPLAAASGWSLGGHAFIQGAILASGLASLVHQSARFTARAFHPGLLLMGSFLFLIAGGTLLLKMPRCVVPGETCSWLDALFTSASAVCITGLTVQNTATFFSLTGQSVILLLIQTGGLGIMTLTFFAAILLFGGLSLHDRLLLGKMIQENRLARIGRTLTFIVLLTFICETIGAVALYLSMDGIADPGARLFHAVFHAVSAFCNAGFSTFPDGLASGVALGNGTWQVVIMLLVVIGGLGPLVNEDLSLWTVAGLKRRLGRGGPTPRLRIHTRLVLAVTGILILGGAGLILVTEFLLRGGPENGGPVLTACFHSITARTAGFNTVPMLEIGPLTVQILMVLMIIGGSPGGTAGGLRTTVVAVGLGHLWIQLRQGRRGMVVFNRTIPRETGAQALGLIVLAGFWLGANFVVLQLLQAGSGVAETTLWFELISAFATVGLSLDLTPGLTAGGKALLIVNMFVGRIGLLAVLATLIPRDPSPASGKPSENILLT